MTRPQSAQQRGTQCREEIRATLRVLLVEDYEDARETILDLLEILGYRVVAAGDVQEALSLGVVPDVLVSDIELPDGTGCELLSKLRARPEWSNVPAIAVSAHDDPDDVLNAERAGFVRYLVKPMSIHALDHAILELASSSAHPFSPVGSPVGG